MRADMLNKINILKPVYERNEYGEPETTWLSVFTNVYASKEPLLGNEFFKAAATQSKAEVKYRTYYFSGVETDMRIYDEDGMHEILSVINVKSLNRELLIYCKKVTDDG